MVFLTPEIAFLRLEMKNALKKTVEKDSPDETISDTGNAITSVINAISGGRNEKAEKGEKERVAEMPFPAS
jgi:hypothetical protein